MCIIRIKIYRISNGKSYSDSKELFQVEISRQKGKTNY